VQNNVRSEVTFLLLDALLGEDGVERWIGRVEAVTDAPQDAKDPGALQVQIQDLAREATGERFTLGQAPAPGGGIRIVALNTSLKHIDHLDKPFRLRLMITLKAPAPNGLPTQAESQELDAFEDKSGPGFEGAVFAGRVTGGGVRTLNWYVADPGGAEAAVTEIARHRGWKVEARTDLDPRWEGLKRNLLD
jgi:hypothetical protein